MGPNAYVEDRGTDQRARILSAGLAVLIFLTIGLPARAEHDDHAVTTFSLSQSGSDVGLLSPYRHGLINDLQINAYPETRLITPNITINKQWGRLSGWQFISTHELNTPILFLSSSTCDGGCSLAPTAEVSPQLLNLNSHFYFRRQLSNAFTVTPNIGVELNSGGLSSTELNQLGLQFNPFRPGYSINTGIDISGNFAENWGYSADLEYFSVAGLSGDPVLGHKAMLFYEWKKNQRVAFGYKYTSGLGNYQYDAHAYPMLDFLWSWE
jgi:hypothetical protein